MTVFHRRSHRQSSGRGTVVDDDDDYYDDDRPQNKRQRTTLAHPRRDSENFKVGFSFVFKV